jgi:hypothetical protein
MSFEVVEGVDVVETCWEGLRWVRGQARARVLVMKAGQPSDVDGRAGAKPASSDDYREVALPGWVLLAWGSPCGVEVVDCPVGLALAVARDVGAHGTAGQGVVCWQGWQVWSPGTAGGEVRRAVRRGLIAGAALVLVSRLWEARDAREAGVALGPVERVRAVARRAVERVEAGEAAQMAAGWEVEAERAWQDVAGVADVG